MHYIACLGYNLIGCWMQPYDPHQQIPNKVTIKFDIFNALMENEIVSNKYSSLIVIIHLNKSSNINTQVVKERMNL